MPLYAFPVVFSYIHDLTTTQYDVKSQWHPPTTFITYKKTAEHYDF